MQDTAGREVAALLDVDQVALLLGCSAKHVSRLSSMNRMPVPVKLGALVRWNRVAIEHWIDDGCPDMAREGGAK